MPDIKPVTVKSGRFSKEDAVFLDQEVKQQLLDDIIKSSSFTWRAQVFVVNERIKNY